MPMPPPISVESSAAALKAALARFQLWEVDQCRGNSSGVNLEIDLHELSKDDKRTLLDEMESYRSKILDKKLTVSRRNPTHEFVISALIDAMSDTGGHKEWSHCIKRRGIHVFTDQSLYKDIGYGIFPPEVNTPYRDPELRYHRVTPVICWEIMESEWDLRDTASRLICSNSGLVRMVITAEDAVLPRPPKNVEMYTIYAVRQQGEAPDTDSDSEGELEDGEVATLEGKGRPATSSEPDTEDKVDNEDEDENEDTDMEPGSELLYFPEKPFLPRRFRLYRPREGSDLVMSTDANAPLFIQLFPDLDPNAELHIRRTHVDRSFCPFILNKSPNSDDDDEFNFNRERTNDIIAQCNLQKVATQLHAYVRDNQTHQDILVNEASCPSWFPAVHNILLEATRRFGPGIYVTSTGRIGRAKKALIGDNAAERCEPGLAQDDP
ncbi:hypothetical protein A0H81_14066 [Grifola frondosa]|uniref:Uncharacterized protein n=1 Tax=Grifola frondosa TaxID=5627 RepID=A0A1C7LM33_GRIFR|nr:hypothetical protein A0H81_14066 [Grifola frondosa]